MQTWDSQELGTGISAKGDKGVEEREGLAPLEVQGEPQDPSLPPPGSYGTHTELRILLKARATANRSNGR